MDAGKIRKLAEISLSGSLPFPQIVDKLIEEGVEYYHVDYAALQIVFYGGEGAIVSSPLIIEGLPEAAKEFDRPALQAAILDSQRNNQKFRDFSRRAVKAGVQNYFAFLIGKRVTYFGRHGDHHVEWFPGAKPDAVEFS